MVIGGRKMTNKLTKEQWDEIYVRIYRNREMIAKLSREYGVSRVAIYEYGKRNGWNSIRSKIGRLTKWIIFGR